MPGHFDLIRAANVLNRGYFDDATLIRMAGALLARLGEGGVLVAVRSDAATGNHATLWRREGGRLVEVERLGTGSEAAPMIEVAATSPLAFSSS